MMPTVSVIMPAYNAERFLAEAIDSVLAQTYPDWELLLLNDGSTDGTRAVAQQFADPRIRLVDNSDNLGLTRTLNRGIELAQGRYLARLDADDVAYPARLATQVTLMEQRPAVALCGTWADEIDAAGKPVGAMQLAVADAEIPALMLFHNCFYHSTVMLRASYARQLYDPAFPIQEDYEFWVRLGQQAPLALLPQRLVGYRIHGGNVTITKREAAQHHTQLILARQLTRLLGQAPTPAELALHQQVGHHDLGHGPAFFQAAAQWLARLQLANHQQRQFAPAPFSGLLGRRWGSLCAHFVGLGATTLAALDHSPLTSHVPAAQLRKIRWLCQLHRAPWRQTLLPLYRRVKGR
jgi:hypothetical protein